MFNKKLFILFSVSCMLCSVCCILFTVPGYAAVPQTINFQGRLTDANGNVLSGTVNLYFRIYDAETGGTTIWGPETHSPSLDNGTFNVMLGSFTYVTPITYDVFNGNDRWVEVRVGNDAAGSALIPRQKIGSVAYALTAYNATASTGNFNVGGNIVMPANATVDGVDLSSVTFGGGSQSLSSTNTWTGQNTFTTVGFTANNTKMVCSRKTVTIPAADTYTSVFSDAYVTFVVGNDAGTLPRLHFLVKNAVDYGRWNWTSLGTRYTTAAGADIALNGGAYAEMNSFRPNVTGAFYYYASTSLEDTVYSNSFTSFLNKENTDTYPSYVVFGHRHGTYITIIVQAYYP